MQTAEDVAKVGGLILYKLMGKLTIGTLTLEIRTRSDAQVGLIYTWYPQGNFAGRPLIQLWLDAVQLARFGENNQWIDYWVHDQGTMARRRYEDLVAMDRKKQ